MLSAAEIIRLLELEPHPEGGHYRQTFRDSRTVDGTRPVSTAIYFLLVRGERSHWHKVDAVEIWHWHAGAPLMLDIAATKQRASSLASISDRHGQGAGESVTQMVQRAAEAGDKEATELLPLLSEGFLFPIIPALRLLGRGTGQP